MIKHSMKNSNVILYTQGAYGNFINWCCDYFSGNLNSHDIPLNDLGNCHGYTNGKNMTVHPLFKNYTESDIVYSFVQVHENSFSSDDTQMIFDGKLNNLLIKNLTFLQDNYKKSIYIYPTETSKLWITNNYIYKIRMSDWTGKDTDLAREYLTSLNAPESLINESLCYGDDKLRKQIENHASLSQNLIQWGHSNINDFDQWELREFASKYFYDRMSSIIIGDEIAEISTQFPNIHFIKLDDLRTNFAQTIFDILKHFDVDPIQYWDNIDSIHQIWLSKQAHINKDLQVAEIVAALLSDSPLDWSDWKLTTVDEFTIQRLLSDNQVEIKCYNLNEFPTNTKDFTPLLEKQ